MQSHSPFNEQSLGQNFRAQHNVPICACDDVTSYVLSKPFDAETQALSSNLVSFASFDMTSLLSFYAIPFLSLFAIRLSMDS